MQQLPAHGQILNPCYVSYFERQGQADLINKIILPRSSPHAGGPAGPEPVHGFFSATLLPMDYFMKLLTGAEDHPRRIFPSPFPVGECPPVDLQRHRHPVYEAS